MGNATNQALINNYWLKRILCSKKCLFFFLLFVVGILADFGFLLWWSPKGHLLPVKATFLVGVSKGHLMQKLLLWFLPFYLFLTPASWFLADKKVGNLSILFSKMGKKNYFKQLSIVTFLFSSVTVFIGNVLNFVLASIVNNGYTQDPSIRILPRNGKLTSVLPEDVESRFPIATIWVYFLLFSVLVGAISLIVLYTTILLKRQSTAMLGIIVVWYALLGTDYSLISVMQPFIDSEISWYVKGLALSAHVLLVVFLCWGAKIFWREDGWL